MGSSNEKTLSYSGTPEAAFAAAERALIAIGAKVTLADPAGGKITATKGETFVSRGEVITLHVERLADGCALHLRSASQDDIDWGRNAGNIAQFEQVLTGGAAMRGDVAPASPSLPAAGSTLPSTNPLLPSPPPPFTAASPAGAPEREMGALTPSIFGPSAFASVFASSAPTSPDAPAPAAAVIEQPAGFVPQAADSVPLAEVEAPVLPAPDAAGLPPAEQRPEKAASVAGQPVGEAERAEAQSLLAKLEARRISLEANAPPRESIDRPSPRRDEHQSQQRGWQVKSRTREPEPAAASTEGRFFCSVDGEFGPVEPCARCGLYLCARHRRRSRQSAIFTNALYVCESCFEIEVAEERGSSLNIRPISIAPSFPSIQRTDSGLRMEAGDKPANVWAALGTAVSLLLVVLFLTALSRSFGGFLFFLTLAVIGGYIWAFNVHWWTDDYLAAATPGRRRAVWLLAVPGLFIAGATLRLVEVAFRAVGARERAARLDPTREQIIAAAEAAWNQAMDG